MLDSGKKTLGRSRAKYEVKPLLAKWIELVNQVEPSATLWELNDMYRVVAAEKPQLTEDEILKEAITRCLRDLNRKQVKGSDKKIIKYIRASKNLFEVAKYYEDFRHTRLNLCSIAHANQLRPGTNPLGQPLIGGFIQLLKSLESRTFISIDEQGFFRVTTDSFNQLIDGVLADRIRKCAICQRIFWAQRSDKWGCSEKCNNTIRQRRSYQNWNEKGQQYLSARKKKAKLKRKSAKKGK
ncbi:MAG TPA: hypothetical protein VGC91_05700 [Pyrinomonadaceae bacterium]|jgi:hypothetical protein